MKRIIALLMTLIMVMNVGFVALAAEEYDYYDYNYPISSTKDSSDYYNPPMSIRINCADSVGKGGMIYINVTVQYADGTIVNLSRDEYNINIEDSYILHDDGTYLVAGSMGSTVVTVTGRYGTDYEYLSDTKVITVYGQPDSFTLLDTNIYMAIGDTKKVEPKFYCEGELTQQTALLKYSSNNESVCTVANGQLRAIASGEAVITVSSTGMSSQYMYVTVTAGKSITFKSATQGKESMTIHWNAASGATGYRLERSLKNKDEFETLIENKNITSYKDDEVVDGKTYTYRISYYGTMSNGAYGWSDVTEKNFKFVAALTTPRILSSKKINQNGSKIVQVKWKKVTDASQIVIQIKKATSSSYKTIGTTKKTNTIVNIPYTSQYFSKGKNSIRIYTQKTTGGTKVKSKMSNVKTVKY